MNPERLSVEILDYLVRHPKAQDTLEGIAEWWLMEQRIQKELEAVRQALDALKDQGLVRVRQAADGRTYYRLNEEKQAAVEAMLAAKHPELGRTKER